MISPILYLKRTLWRNVCLLYIVIFKSYKWLIYFDNVHVNNDNSRPCDGIHFLTNFMSTLLLPVRCWFCLIVYSYQTLFLLWCYVITKIGKEEYINLIPFRIWTAKYFEPQKIPVCMYIVWTFHKLAHCGFNCQFLFLLIYFIPNKFYQQQMFFLNYRYRC